MREVDRDGSRLTRRRLLGMMGIGAGAALVAACAPAATAPTATIAATQAPATSAAATPAATPAATAAATPAPATPSPTPQRTPFSITSMANPLIDDHAHPIAPAQGDISKYYDGLVQLMDQNNVAMTILHRNADWTTPVTKFGPDHDDRVRAAMDRHPGRLLGFLAGFDPASPDAPNYVRAQLERERGRWKAIGELDLRNPGPRTQIPINSPIMMQIHKIAADFKVPLVFHYNADFGTASPQIGFAEVEDAVAKNPNTTFVFAHNPIPPFMQKYPNLWAEVSPFSPMVQQTWQGVLADPALLDRIVLCLTDLQTPDLRVVAGVPTPITYAEAVAKARSLLAGLTQEQRDKVAYKNMMRLLRI